MLYAMSENFKYLFFLASYFLGSIPTAYLVGKAKKIDIRKVGSGNVGATNTARILGKRWAALVLLIDIIKGLFAVLVARKIFQPNESAMYYVLASGFLAVVGHIFPVWLNFKGGKGVATVCGVVIGLSPFQALIAFFLFVTVLYITRYVSVSSIFGAVSLPVSFFLFFSYPENSELLYFFTGLAIIILLMHIKNIRRLLSGTESKISSFAK